MRFYLICPLILILIQSCSSVTGVSTISEQEARAAILDIHEAYEKAVPAKDIDAILRLYEDRAVYLPFQGKILTGKEQISTAWASTFQLPVTHFDLELVSLEVTGNLVHEVGRTHSVFDLPGGPQKGEFKYLNIWRVQTDGTLKIYRAAYNQWVETNN